MSHKQLRERCWDAIECNEVKCVKSQAQFKQLRFKMFYYLKWVILSYCLRDMYLIKLYPLFKFNYCCKFILLVIIGFILCIAGSTMAPEEEADSVLGSSWRKLGPKRNYLSWRERMTQTTTIIAYSMIYTHLRYLLENGCKVCIMSVTVWSSWCCNFYYLFIFLLVRSIICLVCWLFAEHFQSRCHTTLSGSQLNSKQLLPSANPLVITQPFLLFFQLQWNNNARELCSIQV